MLNLILFGATCVTLMLISMPMADQVKEAWGIYKHEEKKDCDHERIEFMVHTVTAMAAGFWFAFLIVVIAAVFVEVNSLLPVFVLGSIFSVALIALRNIKTN